VFETVGALVELAPDKSFGALFECHLSLLCAGNWRLTYCIV
jgi:hypothetical protein